ncbi:MAG: hypothetical protein ED557_01540 [Balneola sp.]|nr:MAG: hypothetical protein ED557_01540 [Balneola sp.]
MFGGQARDDVEGNEKKKKSHPEATAEGSTELVDSSLSPAFAEAASRRRAQNDFKKESIQLILQQTALNSKVVEFQSAV